jgi:hypothetical protein
MRREKVIRRETVPARNRDQGTEKNDKAKTDADANTIQLDISGYPC